MEEDEGCIPGGPERDGSEKDTGVDAEGFEGVAGYEGMWTQLPTGTEERVLAIREENKMFSRPDVAQSSCSGVLISLVGSVSS